MSNVIKSSLFVWYGADGERWRIVWEMNAQKQTVSLRLLDWLVTNYAKEHGVRYMVSSIALANKKSIGAIREEPFNVHTAYRSSLKTYRKTNFDPFRRGERFYFDGQSERPEWAELKAALKAEAIALRAEIEGTDPGSEKNERLQSVLARLTNLKAMRTTVGQLNFFRWAISRDVFAWASENRMAIESDMAEKSASHRRLSVAGDGGGDEDADDVDDGDAAPDDEGKVEPLVLKDQDTSARIKRLAGSISSAPSPPYVGLKRFACKRIGKRDRTSSHCRSSVGSTGCIVFNVGSHLSFSNYSAPKPF
jgi:hypothetical protein